MIEIADREIKHLFELCKKTAEDSAYLVKERFHQNNLVISEIHKDIKTHNLSDLPPKLEKADCVSLHLSLNEHSKKFLNKSYLLMLKIGCIIVNTARGELIDEESLFNISKEKNFMCIFNVFSNEPYSGLLNNLSENQFFKTPHAGSNSIEFLESCANDFICFIKNFNHSDR